MALQITDAHDLVGQIIEFVNLNVIAIPQS